MDYFFLCLFFLKRFLRLWVAILCLFLFFPLGIGFTFYPNWLTPNFHLTLFLTFTTNVLAGLKAGMLCAGIMMVVFLEMFRAVFSARFLTIKLPNPLKYTFWFLANDPFTLSMKASTAF